MIHCLPTVNLKHKPESMQTDIQPIIDFLPCRTPEVWIQEAIKPENLENLLIDHCNNEKKAAATAFNLMFRYVDKPELLSKMSRLAREELRHFEQVVALMVKRNIGYRHMNASGYAAKLRKGFRNHEPAKLIDTLIIGAFIEARSCERFHALAPHLDQELNKFYLSLLKSESRHFQDYLTLARSYADEPIESRIEHFSKLEADAILSADNQFRFHSGVPTSGS